VSSEKSACRRECPSDGKRVLFLCDVFESGDDWAQTTSISVQGITVKFYSEYFATVGYPPQVGQLEIRDLFGRRQQSTLQAERT